MLLDTKINKKSEEAKKIYIIDSHSHFGKDNFWLNFGDSQEYINYTQCYVNEVFAMSVPCPIIIGKDGSKTILSYYETVGSDIKHYKVEEKCNGDIKYTPNF